MKTFTHWKRLPALLATALMILPAFGQQDRPARPGHPGAPGTPQALAPLTGQPYNPKTHAIDPLTGQLIPKSEPDAPTFDIEYLGGPPETLMAVLRNALRSAGVVPNVIIAPSMADAQIPPFELHNVTVEDVFNALNTLSDLNQSGRWQRSGSSETIWVLNPVQPSTHHVPSFIPTSLRQQQAPQGSRSAAIFPVGKYLEDYSIEDLTTAVQTAWGMLEARSQADLKFHQDTKLLIAVGTPEQLTIITSVLKSLDTNQQEMRAKAEVKPSDTAQPTFQRRLHEVVEQHNKAVTPATAPTQNKTSNPQ